MSSRRNSASNMSKHRSPHPSCGNVSRHCRNQASRGALHQREGAHPALDRGAPRRSGAAAGSGALWQCGADQPGVEAADRRGQAGADRHGGVCQGGAGPDLRHSDGTPAPWSAGRRNLRSAWDPLAAGCGTAALQRTAHHPGALAHDLRYRKAPHQSAAADRQAGGGV